MLRGLDDFFWALWTRWALLSLQSYSKFRITKHEQTPRYNSIHMRIQIKNNLR